MFPFIFSWICSFHSLYVYVRFRFSRHFFYFPLCHLYSKRHYSNTNNMGANSPYRPNLRYRNAGVSARFKLWFNWPTLGSTFMIRWPNPFYNFAVIMTCLTLFAGKPEERPEGHNGRAGWRTRWHQEGVRKWYPSLDSLKFRELKVQSPTIWGVTWSLCSRCCVKFFIATSVNVYISGPALLIGS